MPPAAAPPERAAPADAARPEPRPEPDAAPPRARQGERPRTEARPLRVRRCDVHRIIGIKPETVYMLTYRGRLPPADEDGTYDRRALIRWAKQEGYLDPRTEKPLRGDDGGEPADALQAA